jgi:hypothetical protein
MSRTAFTLRIDAKERNALKNLSQIEGRPMNQLLNEAIQIYLRQKGRKERSLEKSLNSLRAYRRNDPRFKRAIEAFAEAEANQKDDPVEGEPVESADDPSGEKGPVQHRVLGIIGA